MSELLCGVQTAGLKPRRLTTCLVFFLLLLCDVCSDSGAVSELSGVLPETAMFLQQTHLQCSGRPAHHLLTLLKLGITDNVGHTPAGFAVELLYLHQ